jgi:sugar (pentulose or hexulose) kinase
VLHRPACGESAFGAAVLSAVGTHYNSIMEAVGRMVGLERTFTPDHRRAEVYDRAFDRFCGELRKRGYL